MLIDLLRPPSSRLENSAANALTVGEPPFDDALNSFEKFPGKKGRIEEELLFGCMLAFLWKLELGGMGAGRLAEPKDVLFMDRFICDELSDA